MTVQYIPSLKDPVTSSRKPDYSDQKDYLSGTNTTL